MAKKTKSEKFILLIITELPDAVILYRLPLSILSHWVIDVLKRGHGWIVNAEGIKPKAEQAVLNVMHACTRTDSPSRTDPESHAHVSPEWRKIDWSPYRIDDREPIGPTVATYQMGMYC